MTYFFKDSKRNDINEDFTMGKKLGSGAFSIVRQAVEKSTEVTRAVKIIEKSNLDVSKESLQAEVTIMRSLNDPNICKLFDVYESPERVQLVMELLTGGELFDRIVTMYPEGYSESVASQLIAKITRSIWFLHSKGIVHRDLKPENLIYASDDDTEIKITDFGLAKLSDGEYLLMTACGTPNYVAPEVLLNQGYDSAVDMWSIGVILYILLCGFPPFYSENTPDLFDQILTANYTFPSPYWDNVSKQAKDLVKKLLQVEPQLRYSPKQVLKHPWITGYSTSKTVKNTVQISELKKFNARRKLKGSIQAALAARRFINRLKGKGGIFGKLLKKK